MFKFIFLFFTLVFSGTSAFSQTENYSAPVKWERYKVSGSAVSFLMPKLPTRLDSFSECDETESSNYSAYAEDAVYSIIIYTKSSVKIPDDCKIKRKFGDDTISKIKDFTKSSMKEFSEAEILINGNQASKFSNDVRSTWILDNLRNNRIFEVSISRRQSANVDEKRFLESISDTFKEPAIEIGSGAVQTLGDSKIDMSKISETKTENKDEKSNIENLIIVGKPKPLYTNEARLNNLQGIATLKVTFLANGGIGEIVVVKTLENGLTEQAIAAAKKMTFLPVKRSGLNQTVVKTVQYSFSIY